MRKNALAVMTAVACVLSACHDAAAPTDERVGTIVAAQLTVEDDATSVALADALTRLLPQLSDDARASALATAIEMAADELAGHNELGIAQRLDVAERLLESYRDDVGRVHGEEAELDAVGLAVAAARARTGS